MSRLLIPALLLAATANAAESKPDPFAGLSFLLGDWVALQTGAPGEPSGGFSLAPDLGGKVLVRHNEATYPPKQGEKDGAHHTDLTIVFPEAGVVRAIYFDNEGHTIRYVVTTHDKTATFESEGSPYAPRFKLVYEMKPDDGALGITFLIAAPGQAYKPYITASAKRRPAKP